MLSCGIIRGCVTIKINIEFSVVCIGIVPHCGTNRGCGINRGNTVVSIATVYVTQTILLNNINHY